MNVPAAESGGLGYPRYIRLCGRPVNSFKVFLCLGLYVAIIAATVLAERSGQAPLPVGLGLLACATFGVVGARVYHLVVFAAHYRSSRASIWDAQRGGGSVFGGLIPLALTAWLLSLFLHVPAPQMWDWVSAGVLFGGFWIRLGCVFNGCCAGRETASRLGVRLHDTNGVCKRRVPVQFLEMGWWALGWAWFLVLWPRALPHGAYGLAVLAWYGLGRFWLEALRERPDLVAGRFRINRWMAAILALSASFALAVLLGAH